MTPKEKALREYYKNYANVEGLINKYCYQFKCIKNSNKLTKAIDIALKEQAKEIQKLKAELKEHQL